MCQNDEEHKMFRNYLRTKHKCDMRTVRSYLELCKERAGVTKNDPSSNAKIAGEVSKVCHLTIDFMNVAHE